ncbi:MAG: apolipoprotein N-acyltransferase [Halieaceae bacterium]|jgi:apolipoprotein N-acyltransferase
MLNHPVMRSLLAIVAGISITLAMAPFHLWPLAIFSCCTLLYLLRSCANSRAAFLLGWCHGLGMFGSGISWVYVSIHNYGNASVVLAGLLTAVFCMGLAVLPALMAWLFVRHLNSREYFYLLTFPALWVLFEWLRSWLLTGFPWLYIGYAPIDTWLAGWAPLIGVYGLSFIICLSAAGIYTLFHRRNRFSTTATAVVVTIWLTGLALQQVAWVESAEDDELSVALVQANIPQELKWLPEYYQPTLDLYASMTAPLLGNDLLIWPEAAIPSYFHRAQGFLQPMSDQAEAEGTTLITGIPHAASTGNGYHNSIVALGRGQGVYHKQRLVPFGEYVPLQSLLRGLIDFFDLPMSHFSPGAENQTMLQAGNYQIAPFICYEIVYPALVRKQAGKADILVTISNDSWFGGSIGPLQHLQMARMRALENGRYLIRGTNNGVSAIIDERGGIVAKTPQFEATSLTGGARVFSGQTPFNLLGSIPTLLFCAIALAVALLMSRASATRFNSL